MDPITLQCPEHFNPSLPTMMPLGGTAQHTITDAFAMFLLLFLGLE
jgi:hypothetical protein